MGILDVNPNEIVKSQPKFGFKKNKKVQIKFQQEDPFGEQEQQVVPQQHVQQQSFIPSIPQQRVQQPIVAEQSSEQIIVPVSTDIELQQITVQQAKSNLDKIREELAAEDNLIKIQQQLFKTKKESKNNLSKALKSLTKNTKKVTIEDRINALYEQRENINLQLTEIEQKLDLYENKLYRAINDEEYVSEKGKVRLRKLISNYEKLVEEYQTELDKINSELTKYNSPQYSHEGKNQQVEITEVIDTATTEKLLIQQKVVDAEDVVGIDTPKVIKQIESAIEEIPDADDFEITDIIITTPGKRKDKTGYFKTKVNIKTNNIPPIINEISSYVKKLSNGVIKPRVCDLRVIGNTNKTQLRNSQLKLTTRTIVFKPNFNHLKVNKGTRIMISIPEEFETTSNLLVYIQESRAKTILEVTGRDFDDDEQYVKWLGTIINDYYTIGYQSSLYKLQLRGRHNPFMEVIKEVLSTKDFKASILADEENNIYGVDFIKTEGDNHWLQIQLRQHTSPGLYAIKGFNTVSNDSYSLIDLFPTYDWLKKNMTRLLYKTFDRDWSKELNQSEYDKDFYNIKKITHKKLWDAYTFMKNNFIGYSTDSDEEQIDVDKSIGLEILNTLSKSEMKKFQSGDYDAEAIVGKTNFVDSFVLMYYGHAITGGDKRHGSVYITTDDYYERTGTKTRASYAVRNKILPGQEANQKIRNYNTRKYMFMLKYVVKGIEYSWIGKNFQDILDATNFLSASPNKVSITD